MASGDTLAVLWPEGNQATGAGVATYTTRNKHGILQFDASSNEIAIWSVLMPEHYGGGGVTVVPHYSMASATSGDVDWDGQFERVGDGQQDVDSDGFAAANSQNNITVPATSGHVDIPTGITFTDGADMDSVAAGEKFRFELTRDAANDTAAGNAEIHLVHIKET